MTALPSPQLLLSVFAKTEHFGRMTDTPYGLGYRLNDLTTTVSFFGHHLYFCYQQAVLILSNEYDVSFVDPEHPANPELLQQVYAIDQYFSS
jgi:hypothetical protein